MLLLEGIPQYWKNDSKALWKASEDVLPVFHLFGRQANIVAVVLQISIAHNQGLAMNVSSEDVFCIPVIFAALESPFVFRLYDWLYDVLHLRYRHGRPCAIFSWKT